MFYPILVLMSNHYERWLDQSMQVTTCQSVGIRGRDTGTSVCLPFGCGLNCGHQSKWRTPIKAKVALLPISGQCFPTPYKEGSLIYQ